MKGQRILLTGGHGFVGSQVARVCSQRGYTLRLLLRPQSRTSRVDDLGFERAPGDVRDLNSLLQAAQDCQGIIHLASPSSWAEIQSKSMGEIVVGGTGNVLEAARRLGGVRTVFVSSSTAVGGTWTPVVHHEESPFTLTSPVHHGYALAKHQAEKLCLAAGPDVPVIRVNPAEVYGPGDVDRITAGNLIDFATSYPVLVTSGGTSVAHVEDVAEGIVAAFERGRPGERYILGGENLTIRDLASLTLEVLGLSRPILVLPRWALLGLAWLGRNLRVPLPFEPGVAPYAVRYWFMDNSKACQELGIRFRSGRETLQSTIDWLRSAGMLK